MERIVKTVKLNLLRPTKVKQEIFNFTAIRYINAINLCKDAIEYWEEFTDMKPTKYNLHKICYKTIRENLPAQLSVDAIRDAWMNREHYCARVRKMAISFNVHRSGNMGETKHGHPMARIKLNGKRVAIPIKMDGAWFRFKEHIDTGWGFTQFRVVNDDGKWTMVVMLKMIVVPKDTDGMLGVDIGSTTLASISIVDNGCAVKRQLYFGRDLVRNQQRILKRRSNLRSKADKGSRRADKSLKRLKGYEKNFTKTRCYQIAHHIVNLAIEHGTSISIENLNHLNRSRLGRASNRKVKKMPYNKFRVALETVAGQFRIPVVVVPSRNTSRECSDCGNIDKKSRKGQTYKCVKCGFLVNADRNASVNIARRGLSLERAEATDIPISEAEVQLSSDGGRVNGPVRDHDGGAVRVSQTYRSPEFKPPNSLSGC